MLIRFGQGHDAKFAESVTGVIPEGGIMKTELEPDRYRVVL
jgi:hypothetical protein